MKSWAWVAASGVAMCLAGAAAAQDCAPERLDIRGDWGTARFGIEIADDPAEQSQGLMFRESLAASAGMLFVYPRAGSPSFWMKNTLIPLDMLFIRPDGTVAHVHENAVPGDLTPIRGGQGVLAVLEIRGGLSSALGIEPGDEVRHPAFEAAGAAWACETGPETATETETGTGGTMAEEAPDNAGDGAADDAADGAAEGAAQEAGQ